MVTDRAAVANQRLRALLNTEVEHIGISEVILRLNGQPQRLANDAVIVCVGGVLPTTFPRKAGVDIEVRHRV
jgi:thioredoxin reductase (NADPH)